MIQTHQKANKVFEVRSFEQFYSLKKTFIWLFLVFLQNFIYDRVSIKISVQ